MSTGPDKESTPVGHGWAYGEGRKNENEIETAAFFEKNEKMAFPTQKSRADSANVLAADPLALRSGKNDNIDGLQGHDPALTGAEKDDASVETVEGKRAALVGRQWPMVSPSMSVVEPTEKGDKVTTPVGRGWAYGEGRKSATVTSEAAAVVPPEEQKIKTPVGRGWAFGEGEQ